MSKTSQCIFNLAENLYTNGSPVIIEWGALQKNTETEELSAQLAIRNISPKTIKTANLSILPLDASGDPLGDIVEIEHTHVRAAHGCTFGEDIRINLADTAAYAFSAIVSEVVFCDGSRWRDTGSAWAPLPAEEKIF